MDISDEKEKAKQRIQDIPPANNHSESRKETDPEFDPTICGRKLQSPILGYDYRLPDLPANYVPSTILDTSLLHIPIYAHLKIYDPKPVNLPEIPTILSALHLLQFSEDKSSREMSTGRITDEGEPPSGRVRDDRTKIANRKKISRDKSATVSRNFANVCDRRDCLDT